MPRPCLLAACLAALGCAMPAAAQHRLLVLNKADHTMSVAGS